MTETITAKDAKELVGIALATCPTAASFLDADAVRAMRTAWLALLADLTRPAAEAALYRYLANPANAGKLPSPGHIRGIAAEAESGRRRAGGDAWGDVAEMRRPTLAHRGYGVDEPPPFEAFADPLVATCVDRLGWRELGNAPADDISARSQFVRLYDSLAANAAEDRAVDGLPGVARPALPASLEPVTALVGSVAKRLTGGAL